MDNALLNKDICYYKEINFHLHVKIHTNSLANPIILHKLSIKKQVCGRLRSPRSCCFFTLGLVWLDTGRIYFRVVACTKLTAGMDRSGVRANIQEAQCEYEQLKDDLALLREEWFII